MAGRDQVVRQAAVSWLVVSLVASLVWVGLAWFPFARVAGGTGSVALLAAAAVTLVAGWVGTVPILLGLATGTTGVGVTGGATAARFGATLVMALVVVLGTEVARQPFLLGLGVGYLVMLVVETKWTLRWLRAGASK